MDLACRVGREVDFTVQGRATRTVTPDRIMYRPDAGTMEIEGTYN
jgi:hypothetical protein